jgi:hypothetical protein
LNIPVKVPLWGLMWILSWGALMMM